MERREERALAELAGYAGQLKWAMALDRADRRAGKDAGQALFLIDQPLQHVE